MIVAAMILVSLILLVVIVAGGSTISTALYQHQVASNGWLAFSQLVAQAQALAPKTGDGATISVVNGPSSWTATLYSGRPDPQYGLGARARLITGAGSLSLGGAPSFGLFVDSAGHLSGQAWSIGTTLPTEPLCNGSLTISETIGSYSLTAPYPCG